MIKSPFINLMCFMIFACMLCLPVYGAVGDMGYQGGISEGTKLPQTTELLLKNAKKNSSAEKKEFVYKEILFFTGVPVEYEGIMTITPGKYDDTKSIGSYTETYNVKNGQSTGGTDSINKTLKFTTNFRKVDGTTQILKDSKVTSWKETVIVDGNTYRIDEKASYLGKSIIEDHKPGVTYYKGNLSGRAVYTTGTGNNTQKLTVQTSGTIYGYSSAWSSVETHRLDVYVYNEIDEPWQLQVQLRPSVFVNKTLQYSKNEPTAISFTGNYYEVTKNQSALSYDIFIMPQQFEDGIQKKGSIYLEPYNTFEQLTAPSIGHLKGHFAEDDINKLFSMQILDGDPSLYIPSQAMTRGQFITALVKAVKLPIEEPAANNKKQTVRIVFPDVLDNRAEYPYIMAAYDAGLAIGKANGRFMPDEPTDRQEAFVIMVRAWGLESRGLDGSLMTRFADDDRIAPWAKKEIYAAMEIELIRPDTEGNLRPMEKLSKADGAAIILNMTNYMRQGLSDDYVEHIVNFSY